MPWARLDWIIAEIEEFSSVSRRTTEVEALQEMICPTMPLEEVTGIPAVSPELVPLSMVTVELQESVDPEMMRAAVDWRLLASRRSSRSWRRCALSASSSSSTFLARSWSFSACSSESVAWSAVRVVKMLPSPWKGAATVAPR